MLIHQFTVFILRILIPCTILLLFNFESISQVPARSGGAQMSKGRFYGKVVDEHGKAVGYASVALYGMRPDSLTKTFNEELIAGQITDDNGDFSLEDLPVFGDFTLKVSFLGYAEVEKKASFGLNRDRNPSPSGSSRPGNPGGQPGRGGVPNFDVDLGNIQLVMAASNLDEVTITAEKTNMVMSLDKKIYRVDKDPGATGGTGVDALKNVPGLAVDLDGNLSLRNGSPQLYVDGRPTTLSINQIASDDIESVEVITNPSAKYEASGGQSGIVNIVLKKDRSPGYSGSVMGGIDSQTGLNLGGNVNVREGKFNVFLNGFLNQRKRDMFGTTERQNLFSKPQTLVNQESEGKMNGTFANLRGGIDWFMDNRNTLTLQGSYMRGKFANDDLATVRTDTLLSDARGFSEYLRESENSRTFRNVGSSLLFKHLYPKKGRELTADINYNSISFLNDGEFSTTYLTSDFLSLERQMGEGGTDMFTFQSDYVDPLSADLKLETGIRASVRKVSNENLNSRYDPSNGEWVDLPVITDNYAFDDRVYAAYTTLSHEMDEWSYQVGIRIESSDYEGFVAGEPSFDNRYPFSFFPSLFVTRKFGDQNNLQFSITRRINRPNFFQLIPFVDYSDSLNLRRGNPDLVPEFTYSTELSYQKFFEKGHNLLATLYYKRANDLITTYQTTEVDPVNGHTYIVSTFANSRSSSAFGLEFTLTNHFGKNVDLTTNVNLYDSEVDATNIQEDLINDQFTWFIKENLNYRFEKGFTFQVSGQYQSKTAFTPSSGGRRFGGFANNSAQGYSIPMWFVDLALRKDLFDRKVSITLNIQDVLRSRRMGSHSESMFFIQDSERRSNAPVFRLNFSYRFGNPDMSLFKRKNMNVNDAGSDMMGN